MSNNGRSLERDSATGTAARVPETYFEHVWINPMTDAGSVHRTMNALMNSMLAPAHDSRFAAGYGPSIDLYESGGNYVVEAAVAGYARENIDIEVSDNHLTLSGKQQSSNESENARYHYREVRRGSFSRTISFPNDIDAENVRAEYHDGILSITVPGSKQASPKKVAIKS